VHFRKEERKNFVLLHARGENSGFSRKEEEEEEEEDIFFRELFKFSTEKSDDGRFFALSRFLFFIDW
jgi:hypothetical protein|tara:strand:+ start:460 stop:660 length:201 start_codon:yes stop_codon:yes gene_type:complete